MKLLLLSATAVALAIGGLAARPAAAAGPVAAADGTRTISFDVFLPLRDTAGLDRLLEAQQDPHSALYRHWLTPAEFKARFGAEPGALARVSATLRAAGFFVTKHASSLRATGHVADAEALFGTKLGLVARPAGGRRLAASATFRLPRALVEAGASVFAFDAHLPERHVHSARVALPENRYSPDGGYWYNDLKQAYHYPSYATQIGGKTLNGQGSNIGILMSSDVLDSDIKAYFDHENFATTTGTPDPAVYQRRPVFGGAAFDPNSGGSFEATLDVEQALGGAPGANLYLYNIPDLWTARSVRRSSTSTRTIRSTC